MAQLPFGVGTIFAPQVPQSQPTPIAGLTSQADILREIYNNPFMQEMFGKTKNKDGKEEEISSHDKSLRYQLMRDLFENDPRVIEQRSRIYEGTMNRIADSAQQRAIQGHLFKGFVNLPKNAMDAVAAKLTFAEPTFNLIREGTQGRPAQVARQYNILA
jgi:hypothetical protein